MRYEDFITNLLPIIEEIMKFSLMTFVLKGTKCETLLHEICREGMQLAHHPLASARDKSTSLSTYPVSIEKSTVDQNMKEEKQGYGSPSNKLPLSAQDDLMLKSIYKKYRDNDEEIFKSLKKP